MRRPAPIKVSAWRRRAHARASLESVERAMCGVAKLLEDAARRDAEQTKPCAEILSELKKLVRSESRLTVISE